MFAPAGWFPAPRGGVAFVPRFVTEPDEWGSAEIVAVGIVVEQDTQSHGPTSATFAIEAVARGPVEEIATVTFWPYGSCGGVQPTVIGQRYLIVGSLEGERINAWRIEATAPREATPGDRWHPPKPSPARIANVRVTTVLGFLLPLVAVVLATWSIRAKRARSAVR